MKKTITLILTTLMLVAVAIAGSNTISINDNFYFYVTTHNVSGTAKDADSTPEYRCYEQETGTNLNVGNMSLLDSGGTAGYYSESFQVTSALGYEASKVYSCYIWATVDGTTGATHRDFVVLADGHSLEEQADNIDDIETDTGTTLPTLIGTVNDSLATSQDTVHLEGMISDVNSTVRTNTTEVLNTGAAAWTTATGFATTANYVHIQYMLSNVNDTVKANTSQVITHGDANWGAGSVPTVAEIENAVSSNISEDHGILLYNSSGGDLSLTSENIDSIAEGVNNYTLNSSQPDGANSLGERVYEMHQFGNGFMASSLSAGSTSEDLSPLIKHLSADFYLFFLLVLLVIALVIICYLRCKNGK